MRTLWQGRVGPSKSIANRSLIISSFSSKNLKVEENLSEDVKYLKEALSKLKKGENDFYLGEGGTSFRFFALRASRENFEITIKGSESLFRRPMNELIDLLDQLGVKVSSGRNLIKVKGPWKPKEKVLIDCEKSSQFASAFILSSIGLSYEFDVYLESLLSSKSYFLMSLNLVNELTSSNVQLNGNQLSWRSMSEINETSMERFQIEDDWSSAASVGCLAALSEGEVKIENLLSESVQSDSKIREIFSQMGIINEMQNRVWSVRGSSGYRGVHIDLVQSPDLFPVLSVLCAFAQTGSSFTSLKNLRYKESNRLKNIELLMEALGVGFESNDDSFKILKPVDRKFLSSLKPIDLSPDSDHRIAMAGAVAIQAGARVTIKDKGVVKKSFAHFWEVQRSL